MERYSLYGECEGCKTRMEQDKEGDWIKYDDYKQLQADKKSLNVTKQDFIDILECMLDIAKS